MFSVEVDNSIKQLNTPDISITVVCSVPAFDNTLQLSYNFEVPADAVPASPTVILDDLSDHVAMTSFQGDSCPLTYTLNIDNL